MPNRLRPPVDPRSDHVLGSTGAAITLVEYGSYACDYCKAANERVASLRDHFGDRLCYVYRHRPIPSRPLARQAADLLECAQTPKDFWRAHVHLMELGEALTPDHLEALSREFGILDTAPDVARARIEDARGRVDQDVASAAVNHVAVTPTFFINGRRYDGAWDTVSLMDALDNSLGYRMRVTALDFARWAPSAGLLLLVATLVTVLLSNSPVAPAFETVWARNWGVTLFGRDFRMPLRTWVNDGLLTFFFLVVSLEIKREFTIGHLSSRATAVLPIAAAIGGLAVPALLYRLLIPEGPWAHGWGVPMSTDTAFAVALIAMMGRRVPLELRIFLTAAAIVDDIGAIGVVALFYSGDLHAAWLMGAAATLGALALLNRAHVYSLSPYLLLGVVLWVCIFFGGLHATLAGVVLALFIPTLPPANLKSLMAQANAIFVEEARHSDDVLRHGPSPAAIDAIDAIHSRVESPADRLLRRAALRSSYVVLPLFALANSDVSFATTTLEGNTTLMLAIALGLIVGKPVGLTLAAWLAVRLGWAVKPDAYSWRQLAGAGAMAGIGFTMSLFIASEAFPAAADFGAAKIAIFAASLVSALIGVAVLWNAEASRGRSSERNQADGRLPT